MAVVIRDLGDLRSPEPEYRKDGLVPPCTQSNDVSSAKSYWYYSRPCVENTVSPVEYWTDLKFCFHTIPVHPGHGKPMSSFVIKPVHSSLKSSIHTL